LYFKGSKNVQKGYWIN